MGASPPISVPPSTPNVDTVSLTLCHDAISRSGQRSTAGVTDGDMCYLVCRIVHVK